jgi:hypothetical protein
MCVRGAEKYAISLFRQWEDAVSLSNGCFLTNPKRLVDYYSRADYAIISRSRERHDDDKPFKWRA